MIVGSAADQAIVRDLRADEIQWDLQPVLVDVSLTSVSELLVDAIVDGLSYRLIAVEAFDALRRLHPRIAVRCCLPSSSHWRRGWRDRGPSPLGGFRIGGRRALGS